MLLCQYCNKECKNHNSLSNHSRLCPENPNREKSNLSLSWNKGLTAETDERVARNKDSLIRNGKCTGKAKTPETEMTRKRKLSEYAKKSGFGGYRAGAGRSRKYSVYDSFGNKTTLQSSYEHSIFEILSELSIRWIRPKALKYSGKNYFADFYLIDDNIYLDPKNDYKAKCDFAKVQAVRKENDVQILVILKNQIDKSYIASIVKRL